MLQAIASQLQGVVGCSVVFVLLPQCWWPQQQGQQVAWSLLFTHSAVPQHWQGVHRGTGVARVTSCAVARVI
jgi:hypothetical protein